MAKLQLVRATPQNGIWSRLEKAWQSQLETHDAPQDWAKPYLEHARSIVAESPQEARYGIYVACGSREGNPSTPYEGFVHVNFKLPKTSAAEIRLVWNRIAPKYQFEDLREEVGDIQSAFINGALGLSEDHGKNPPIRMFLGNPIDQQFGRNFSRIISGIPGMQIKAIVRGNWLYISWV